MLGGGYGQAGPPQAGYGKPPGPSGYEGAGGTGYGVQGDYGADGSGYGQRGGGRGGAGRLCSCCVVWAKYIFGLYVYLQNIYMQKLSKYRKVNLSATSVTRLHPKTQSVFSLPDHHSGCHTCHCKYAVNWKPAREI